MLPDKYILGPYEIITTHLSELLKLKKKKMSTLYVFKDVKEFDHPYIVMGV